METLPEGGEAGRGAVPDNPPGRILAEMATGPNEVARVRHLWTRAADLIEIRLWRLSGDGWSPAEGFTLPSEQLPEFRRALAHAGALVASAPPAESPDHAERTARERVARERVRTLARQVALARERLESLRPEDYHRPQDYRRVRTLRIVELRRQENVLARAQAGLHGDADE